MLLFILAASFFVLLTNQLIKLKIFIISNIAKCAIIKITIYSKLYNLGFFVLLRMRF